MALQVGQFLSQSVMVCLFLKNCIVKDTFFSFHLLYLFLTDPYSILTGSFFLPRIVFHIGDIRKQERVLNMLKCVYMEL